MTYQPHHSEDVSLKPTARSANPIPPWERLAVDAGTAASMMSCGKSTFFRRVKEGLYPKPGRDGLWSVSQLRECRARLAN